MPPYPHLSLPPPPIFFELWNLSTSGNYSLPTARAVAKKRAPPATGAHFRPTNNKRRSPTSPSKWRKVCSSISIPSRPSGKTSGPIINPSPNGKQAARKAKILCRSAITDPSRSVPAPLWSVSASNSSAIGKTHRAFWRYPYRQVRMAIIFVYCVGIVSRHTINPLNFKSLCQKFF